MLSGPFSHPLQPECLKFVCLTTAPWFSLSMPRLCAVGGCRNVPQLSKIAVFNYRSVDEKLWLKWDTFMKSTRNWEKGQKQSSVCSAHFAPEDFDNLIAWQMNGNQCLRLKRNAVPSVRPIKPDVSATVTDASASSTCTSKKPWRGTGLTTLSVSSYVQVRTSKRHLYMSSL